jgi:hypothetical protein
VKCGTAGNFSTLGVIVWNLLLRKKGVGHGRFSYRTRPYHRVYGAVLACPQVAKKFDSRVASPRVMGREKPGPLPPFADFASLNSVRT